MKITSLFRKFVLAVATGAVGTTVSQGAFISGGISFSGGAVLDSVPGSASAITFTNPGSVVSVYGDYGLVAVQIPPFQPGAAVYFTNFAFGLPGTVGAIPVNPLWTLDSGGLTYAFRLDNIGVNQFDGSERLLAGDGMVSISGGGYTDTPGRWSLRTSSTTTTITFSSSTEVPDGGTSAVLLGMSLLGLIGGRRLLARSAGSQ
jgi:hypothetical protein